MKPLKKYYNYDDALELLRGYCSYQERCHSQVRKKLLSVDIYGDDLENIIATLIEENYLNEVRFAQIYSRGKFRINKWGRVKISIELKRKGLNAYTIKKGLEEIDLDEYHEGVQKIVNDKYAHYRKGTRYVRSQKVYRYCLEKGYESNLISEALKEIS